MYQKTMDERVTALEKVAESLAPLPAQMAAMNDRMANVESQIVQLRGDLDVRTIEILEVVDSASKATQTMHDEVIRTIREGDQAVLRAVREGDEETRRQMRVLHEDLVERIARLGESRR